MEVAIRNAGLFCTAEVLLDPGDELLAEPGAMVLRDAGVELTPTWGEGGLLGGLKRKVMGESLRLTRISAPRTARVVLAPALPGGLVWLDVRQGPLVLPSGAFVAAHPGVRLEPNWAGARGLLSGGGLVMIRASGRGSLLAAGFGAVREVAVDGELFVDSGHLVAFEESLTWTLSRFGRSWWTSLLGGEGLLVHLRGQGRVWIQSRHAVAFGREVGGRVTPRRRWLDWLPWP